MPTDPSAAAMSAVEPGSARTLIGLIARGLCSHGLRVDVALAMTCGAMALAFRLPLLWLVPRFTDETIEVLFSLAIVRDGARPLTNFDTYYGALYNYVIAVALWFSGESPLAPRLVVALAGAVTCSVTYVLGRSLWVSAGGDTGLPGRLVGAFAALLLATNGPHIVVDSHIAWSNSLTPLLTALGLWLLLAGRWALTGLTLGLAMQTHPLVASLIPGAFAYGLSRHPKRLVSRAPYLALGCFVLGYANVLVFNLSNGFESLASALRIQAEYQRDQQASASYLGAAGTMLVLLVRIVGAAADQRASDLGYLLDPYALLISAFVVFGIGWLARRGDWMPLLVAGGFLLIMSVVNTKYRTLLTVRYLMPIAPLLFACAAVGAARLCQVAHARLGERHQSARVIGTTVVAAGLVLAPALFLGRYYNRAIDRSDTNERIFAFREQISQARDPGEIVLVDEAMGSELPDTGVTEIRGFEHLLIFDRIPYRLVRVSAGRIQDELRTSPAVLVVMNARDASTVAERLAVGGLDSRPAADAGRMFDFRLYRVARRSA